MNESKHWTTWASKPLSVCNTSRGPLEMTFELAFDCDEKRFDRQSIQLANFQPIFNRTDCGAIEIASEIDVISAVDVKDSIKLMRLDLFVCLIELNSA